MLVKEGKELPRTMLCDKIIKVYLPREVDFGFSIWDILQSTHVGCKKLMLDRKFSKEKQYTLCDLYVCARINHYHK